MSTNQKSEKVQFRSDPEAIEIIDSLKKEKNLSGIELGNYIADLIMKETTENDLLSLPGVSQVRSQISVKFHSLSEQIQKIIDTADDKWRDANRLIEKINKDQVHANTSFKKELAARDEIISGYKEQIDQLKNKSSDLETVISSFNKVEDSLKKENAHLLDQIKIINNDLSIKNESISSLAETPKLLENAQAEIAALNKKLESQKKQHNHELARLKQSHQQEIHDLKNTHDKDRLKMLEQEREKFEIKISNISKSHRADIESMKNHFMEIAASNRADARQFLERNVAELTQKYLSSQQEFSKLSKTLQALKDETALLRKGTINQSNDCKN
jgi:DNA repair exonuclease SbcCD ATPase subunit